MSIIVLLSHLFLVLVSVFLILFAMSEINLYLREKQRIERRDDIKKLKAIIAQKDYELHFYISALQKFQTNSKEATTNEIEN